MTMLKTTARETKDLKDQNRFLTAKPSLYSRENLVEIQFSVVRYHITRVVIPAISMLPNKTDGTKKLVMMAFKTYYEQQNTNAGACPVLRLA